MQRLSSVYSITSTLFENEITVIYRAVRVDDGRKVILKTHKRPEDIHKIKHEYDLLKDRNIDGIANVIDIFNNNEDPVYLVSEDNNAVVLEDYITTHTIDETDFYRIAENAATSLATIHNNKIIHRDIKPANMLIHPETLEIWYIDFGISVAIKRGVELWQEGVAGTLDYISPEQTGRIKKTVDYRSDIYSLGITFYRIVTGQMPFENSSAAELIHAHIAVAPIPPIELAPMEPIISTSIMKMLEKKPEDRYQTATSLAFDIHRCRTLKEQGIDSNNFLVGEKDIFYNLEPGHKLYGKEEDLGKLKNAFDNISDNITQIVLLDGDGATGKTMLLNELEHYAVSNNCLLFRTSFREETEEPYAALRRAFDNFDTLVYGPRISLSTYREQILEHLGENTQVLIDILPQMGKILGEQAPIPNVNAMESKTRAQQVFRVFMQVLCKVPFPCVFIFDNMQWADQATLWLLQGSLEEKSLPNCMMVFSYRDPGDADSVRLRANVNLKNLRYNNVTPIHLESLNTRDIANIILDIFPQSHDKANELAQIAYKQSDGNIRRVELYLKDLYHSGVIQLDEATKQWVWNREDIDPLSTRDLDEYVKNIYKKFSPQTMHCINLLCCLNNECTREQIEIIFEDDMTFAQVCSALDVPKNLGYMHYDPQTEIWSFDNSRIRGLAYSMLSEDQKHEIHQKIGQQFLTKYRHNQQQLLKNCTLITDQLNRFDPRNATLEEVFSISALNRIAGDESLKTGNIERAANFYETAIYLLELNPTTNLIADHQPLYMHYASCLFNMGDVEQATEIYERVIAAANTEQARFDAYKSLIDDYLTLADWVSAEKCAFEYLKGHPILLDESKDNTDRTEMERAKTLEYTQGDTKGVLRLLDMEMCQDEEILRLGCMMGGLAEAAVVNLRGWSRYYVYATINLAFEHGPFPGLERGLAMLAERQANRGLYQQAAKSIACGITFSQKYGLPQGTLQAVYCTSVAHWVEPLENIPAIYQKAKHIILLEGNLYYGAFADLMLLNYHLFTGTPLRQVSKDIDAAIYNTEKANFKRFSLVFSAAFRQFVQCMNGRTKSPSSFDDRNFSEEELERNPEIVRLRFAVQFYCTNRMQALFFGGYYDKVLEYADKFFEYFPDNNIFGAMFFVVPLYFYQSLAMLRLVNRNRNLYDQYIPIVHENIAFLKKCAETNNTNFGPKYQLLKAELRWTEEGLTPDLLSNYSDIEQSMQDGNFLWDRCIIEESMQTAWTQQQIPAYSELHREKALEHYRTLGAKLKVIQLGGRKKEHHASTTTTILNSIGMSSSTETTTTSALDYQAVLSIIACLVSESNTQELLSQLLSLLMKNAGAEQALLFLIDNDEIVLRSLRYTERYTLGITLDELPLTLRDIPKDKVPTKLIDLVISKQTQAVANSLDNEYLFLDDPYLEAHQPESFFCSPIKAKGNVIGAIYMENAHLPGLFPATRTSFLNIILIQAAFIIQNALDKEFLQDYTNDLEKRLNSYIGQLNTLIAGIAHEINSPLGVCVTVASRLLERSLEVNNKFNERTLGKSALEEYLTESCDGLDILSNNVNRASGLVQNFKKISVDQAGEIFEEIDLMGALRNIVEYIRPAVKKVIGSYDVTGPESLITYTSTGVLAQIFTNLIMNSSIHAFPGMNKEDCKITIDVSSDEDNIHIVYTDNGRGMTEEEKEQVFMPFFTTRRGEGGSGLGGHIVLTLVTQTLFGSIQCVSYPGRGTSYIMRLPILDEAQRKELINE